ncbi:hypothetical protein SLEP1_g28140 [Rubroshorea leprosula]|uniref:Uncharacterized protein n=1 Tax=Rubroshorea leprosula TaxID=152421 RepID=A0AAV5K236_9ROSI|nr:hypothetical protein SLEP1_g28140 [Rubroshorea leprosula]
MRPLLGSSEPRRWVSWNPGLGSFEEPSRWVRTNPGSRNPAGFAWVRCLGSSSGPGFVEPRAGFDEPRRSGFDEPRRSGFGRPGFSRPGFVEPRAGFDEPKRSGSVEPRPNPDRLGSTDPDRLGLLNLAPGSSNPALGSKESRTPPGFVRTQASSRKPGGFLGSNEPKSKR